MYCVRLRDIDKDIESVRWHLGQSSNHNSLLHGHGTQPNVTVNFNNPAIHGVDNLLTALGMLTSATHAIKTSHYASDERTLWSWSSVVLDSLFLEDDV